MHVLALVGGLTLACVVVGAVSAFGIFKYRNRTPAIEENVVEENRMDIERYFRFVYYLLFNSCTLLQTLKWGILSLPPTLPWRGHLRKQA